jgi:translation initiation factor 2B subunit (eIF-2B alpha/beta/delta family)
MATTPTVVSSKSLVKTAIFLTSDDFYHWLAAWPTVISQLKLIVVGLRRRQLIGAHPCAKATIEILRSLLGTCKFSSTFQMMNAVKAVGRELSTAAPSELTSGNIVRRVLFTIREEYNQKIIKETNEHRSNPKVSYG